MNHITGSNQLNYASATSTFAGSFLKTGQLIDASGDLDNLSEPAIVLLNSINNANQMSLTTTVTPSISRELVSDNKRRNSQTDKQDDVQVLLNKQNNKLNRRFKPEWTELYAFVERDQLPVCLICNKKFKQNHSHLIQSHFRKQHQDFEHHFPMNSAARADEVKRLTSESLPFSYAIDCLFDSRRADQTDLEDVMDENDEDEDEEEVEDDDHGNGSDSELLYESTLQSTNNEAEEITKVLMDIPNTFLSTTFSEQSHSNNAIGQSGVDNFSVHMSKANKRPSKSLSDSETQRNHTSGNANVTVSATNKPRDWRKVTRKFHHAWTDQYLVVESIQHQKPLCLICHKTISAMKVHNIKRHFHQLHSVYFDHHFPVGSQARKTELCRLIEDLRKSQQSSSDTFISVLATPDMWDLEMEDELDSGNAANGSIEALLDNNESSSSQQSLPLLQHAHHTNGSMYHQNGVNDQSNVSTSSTNQLPHPFNHSHHLQCQLLMSSGLTIDKLERAFSHLDKFVAIIEQNDPNLQRSFRVRNAMEIAVDCYKHLLKDMKVIDRHTPAGGGDT